MIYLLAQTGSASTASEPDKAPTFLARLQRMPLLVTEWGQGGASRQLWPAQIKAFAPNGLMSYAHKSGEKSMKFRLEEIEVPEDEPFKFDALKRQPVVEFVRDLIKQLEGPFVLALDSPWGTGKTTMVRMLRASLKRDGFASVYFNAWKEDYVSDPLIPMVAAIDELKVADPEAEKRFGDRMVTVKRVASKVAKRGFVAAVKLGTMNALDLDEVAEDVLSSAAGEVADDLVSAFKQEKKSLEHFREALEGAVKAVQSEDSSKPLVFFIDELDRCRPTFAIELLERVKHLFDVKNLVFVLSVDKKQLEAITAAVYGERIDAPDYLRRFFELEFGIPAVSAERYTSTLLSRYHITEKFAQRKNGGETEREEFSETFSALARHFELSLRMMDRCVTSMAVVLSQTPDGRTLDPSLVALLVILRMKDRDLFTALANGRAGPDQVMKWLGSFGTDQGDYPSYEASLWLEAYLRISDPNASRRDAEMIRLRDLTQETRLEGQEISPELQRLSNVYERCNHIKRGRSGRINLVGVAAKVDMAAMMGDER